MSTPNVDPLLARERPERDVEAALSALERSLRSEPHQPRSRMLTGINAWLTLRRNAGMPMSNSELRQLVVRIDRLLSAAEVPRPYTILVGQRVHLPTGLRFH